MAGKRKGSSDDNVGPKTDGGKWRDRKSWNVHEWSSVSDEVLDYLSNRTLAELYLNLRSTDGVNSLITGVQDLHSSSPVASNSSGTTASDSSTIDRL